MTVTVTAPLLDVQDLAKHFPVGSPLSGKRGIVRGVDGVSFTIGRGEVLGLVGESGSGKTTVGRTVLRLQDPTAGAIRFRGQDITHLSRRALRPVRQHMQLVFQDPYASLNPRMSVESILSAPLIIHGEKMARGERRARVEEALQLVGLFPAAADRYPHEFSGGQRQRIGIARALMLRPELLVADEAVSALDVSVQAQVINLLMDLREQLQLSMLFIAHDLAVVGAISDRVAVMYLGRIVEVAPTAALFTGPRHPYTEALFSAAPDTDPARRPQRIVLKGDLPSPLSPPSGCAFRMRCPYAVSACADDQPALRVAGPGHFKACIRDDLTLSAPLKVR
ncbi:ATP-binding cassette domain-containing protein [Acidisoma cellulosilytica]|uniref:ATP-binding cassette domain-containing protein n=1 Tax=Acidisoma cellulosilyticum TaxID=2802395 RepID=A0A963Z606_9PROT|nr:oligopeptide/dipeptide ABC transporter ATP-binding protein [Acidisoma cellulosilyticum]MCB8883540.1 ATP-binding cassette domain-containing protein [Acidisoma cellulosilyticum]